MTSILINQLREGQFLHWLQDMERKQEEQVRQMKELQDQAGILRLENDQLQAQIKKSRNLGKGAQESDRDVQPIARSIGRGPFFLTMSTPHQTMNCPQVAPQP